MSRFDWLKQKSGFAFREDQFSWQGSYENDRRFFLRRDKYQPDMITDLILGDVNDETAIALIEEFFALSSGINVRSLLFTNILDVRYGKEALVACHDRIVTIIKSVAPKMGVVVTNSFLEQDGSRWNTRIILENAPKE